LKLPQQIIDIQVETFNRVETRIKYSIQVELFSRYINYTESVEFLIIPNIYNQLPNEFIDKRSIDALIRVELFYQFMTIDNEKIPECIALWQKTKIGWILAGKVNLFNENYKITQCIFLFNALHKSIIKFWESEEMQGKHFCLMKNTKSNNISNKILYPILKPASTYTIRLSVNDKVSNLGNSRKIVELQFYRLDEKIRKSSEN
jgi:hypothetical protein